VVEGIDLAIDGCLEKSWFQDSSWVKKEDSIHLYEISQLDKKYLRFRDLAAQEMYRGHYRLASLFADAALSLDYCQQNRNDAREEYFAGDLITLGRYSAAKKVLETLRPVEDIPFEKQNPGPFRAYRQQLMGQALLGMHEYSEAIVVLRREVPDLHKENSTRFYLTLYLAYAYLGLGDNQLALKTFSQLPHWNQTNDTYEAMCQLRAGDAASARKVISAAEVREKILDLDNIFDFDFASDLLLSNGFTKEAKVVAAKAQELRLQ
jgi:tetratricopeptide (TPR) repeat protein